MSWWYDDDVAESRARTAAKVRTLRQKGRLTPVAVASGRKLSTTFWGQAWNRNLESYQDYENRLPRGRTYLREGHVFNLAVSEGLVTATVSGQELYEVRVTIKPLAAARWRKLKTVCAGRVGSLLELLGGKLGDDVMRAVTDPKSGLFPEPKEIRFSCTCPDWADMCKHVAAALYGTGVRLDESPELLFKLRGVDHTELVSAATATTGRKPRAAQGLLPESDLGAIFGIDLAGDDP